MLHGIIQKGIHDYTHKLPTNSPTVLEVGGRFIVRFLSEKKQKRSGRLSKLAIPGEAGLRVLCDGLRVRQACIPSLRL